MRINLVYFASTRDAIGLDAERRDFPQDRLTVAEVLQALESEDPRYEAAFADRTRLRFAVDQEFADVDASLEDGAELGIFPPVTGG